MVIINTKTNTDMNFDYAISFTEDLCLFMRKDGKIDYARMDEMLIIED